MWWDHHHGNTSHSWDFLLLQSAGSPQTEGEGFMLFHPGTSVEKKVSLHQNKYPEEAQVRALESFPGASVALSTDDFGTTSLSAAVPVQPPHGPHGARLGFLPRRDVHADGSNAAALSLTQHGPWAFLTRRLPWTSAVAPAASPGKPALWVLPAGAQKGQGRTLFLPGGCQWNYFLSNNHMAKRIRLLKAHPVCRNRSEGRNWLCRAQHVPPARVWGWPIEESSSSLFYCDCIASFRFLLPSLQCYFV